jgi:hypothetical protein
LGELNISLNEPYPLQQEMCLLGQKLVIKHNDIAYNATQILCQWTSLFYKGHMISLQIVTW